MSLEKELQDRSKEQCELCGSTAGNSAYLVPNSAGKEAQHHVWICEVCQNQMQDITTADEAHWRCLNESIWSETPAVQVLSWRMLHKLNNFSWATDLLDIAYLDDDTLSWAKEGLEEEGSTDSNKHVDCYGAELQKGDSVVLVKTLDVKGATFSAKLGTVVRNIRLVEDNNEQIEGKVNGSQIVILTKYVRKSNPKE
jgi:protein PhnA